MRPAPLIIAALILLATSSNAYSQEPAWIIQSENDAYSSRDDDDYTNGLRVSADFSRAVLWGRLYSSINRGVVDFETGVALGYRRVSGGFRWIWRSPEFDAGRWSRYAGLFVTIGR